MIPAPVAIHALVDLPDCRLRAAEFVDRQAKLEVFCAVRADDGHRPGAAMAHYFRSAHLCALVADEMDRRLGPDSPRTEQGTQLRELVDQCWARGSALRLQHARREFPMEFQ